MLSALRFIKRLPPQYAQGNARMVRMIGFLIAAIIYRSLYTVLSGYIGALIAPSHPMRYAVALGCIALLANLAGAIAM
jgi:hypothetical protein